MCSTHWRSKAPVILNLCIRLRHNISIHDADGNILFCDSDSSDDNEADSCTDTLSLLQHLMLVTIRTFGGYNGASGNFVLDSSTAHHRYTT